MAIKSKIRLEQVVPKPSDYAAGATFTQSASVSDGVEIMANISRLLEDRFGLAYDPASPSSTLSHPFADNSVLAAQSSSHIPFMFDSADSVDVMMGHMGAAIVMHSAGNTDIEVEAGSVLTLRADDQNEDELVILDNSNNRLQFESKIGADDASSSDDDASMLLKSTNGGIKIAAAAAKDLYAEAGQLSFASLDNAAEAIKLHADAGVLETILVKATQSTVDGAYGAGAIQLEAASGGMSFKWSDSMSLHAEGGDMYFVANEDKADAIKLHADAGTSQTIQVLNDEGTDEAAIKLLASAGGIDIDAAATKNVDIAGGQVLISSKTDEASAIGFTTNVGTSETITMLNTLGSSAGAIDIKAAAGGMELESGKRFFIEGGSAGTKNTSTPTDYGLDGYINGVAAADTEVVNGVWFLDKNAASWAIGANVSGLPLSVEEQEWIDYRSAFGEVSLLNALNQAGGGAADAGTYEFKVTGAITEAAGMINDTGVFNANADALKFEGAEPSTPTEILVASQTSMDELFERLSVYVNGQLLRPEYYDGSAVTSGEGDYEVKVLDSANTAVLHTADPTSHSSKVGDGKLCIQFNFALEADDIVVVELK